MQRFSSERSVETEGSPAPVSPPCDSIYTRPSDPQSDVDSCVSDDDNLRDQFARMSSASSVASFMRILTPNQRKFVTMTVLGMALLTAFNVASVGFSLQETKRASTIIGTGQPNGNLRYNSESAVTNHKMVAMGNNGEGRQEMEVMDDYEGGGSTLEASAVRQQQQAAGDFSGDIESMTSFEYQNDPSSPNDPVTNQAQLEEAGLTAAASEYASLTVQGTPEATPQEDPANDINLEQDEVYQMVQHQQEMILKMEQQLEEQNALMKKFQEQGEGNQGAGERSDAPAFVATTQEPSPSNEEVAASAPIFQKDAVDEAAAAATPEDAASATMEMVPPEFAGYKDSWDAHEPTDIPVFWHIPKAGGSTIKDIMGTCHRLIMASEAGVAEGHDQDTEVAVVKIGGNAPAGQDPSVFVNVDTTTVPGLVRAKNLGFAQSGLADAMITPFVFESENIFDPEHRGRLFALFRHPVDRAVSMYSYLQYADWEPTYNPELAKMTIEEYARSAYVENNWMTRYLSNQREGPLSEQNLKVAMDVIRRKFLVGLLSQKEASMERFERFFGWRYIVNPTNQEKCRDALLGTGANLNTRNRIEKPQPGSEAYGLLSWQNQFDIALYEYMEQLFVAQEAFVTGIPNTFRLEGATCCKCEQPPTC